MVHFRTECSTRTLLLVLTLSTFFGFISGVGWKEQASPDTVKQWAERLGKTLSDLGKKVTREAEIKRLYKQLGALVVRRDGESLISEIKKDIEQMVQEKMAAVQCLMETAEDVSYMPPNYVDELENADMLDGLFTYASSKFSPLGTEIEYPMPSPSPPPNYTTGITHYRKPVPPVWYRPIELSPDSHFHNIPVNENFSSVHVPTNVYDRAPPVIEAIEWSEQLDRVFISNYQADPSLTWQYFGSASGFMRHFPGMQWKYERVDLYDCRTQPWYISAVTCSKDVVMLVDVSGSMTGFRYTIAKLVAHSLLDTLTSNDFVSVMTFSEVVTHPVPCFEDMLIQATKENVKVLKDSLDETITEGYANFTAAFTSAFQLLESYRETRGCGEGGCNQAIMLITDGVPGNLTEVFETYNRLNETGEVTIPVRVFTYLLGKEVTNVREIQWMACLNRGYYTHMQSLEEVREEALRYLNVIARPLVLQGTHHPIVWTNAYADFQDRKVSFWLKDTMQLQMERDNKLGFTQNEEDKQFIKEIQTDEGMPRKVQQFQLMTSVSIPVFDRHGNLRNNETTTAELLGVAGLDVPLYLFKRLTRPSKIGVNGYAFLVTNNGYMLMHPDLRPVVQGFSRDNFNSVDFTEIETVDDGSEEPRERNDDMLELRKNMVEHEEGNVSNLKIKFAFDDMRRIAVENRDFFYVPVNGTPFTLGLVLPLNYGRFTIGLGEKFRKIERAGITATNYFHGKNWRIHPEWVYCKHDHDALHEYSSPEERLMDFLRKRDQSMKWKWSSDFRTKRDTDSESLGSCDRKPVPENSYYCDQDLVERLMLEAKALNSWYGTDTWDLRDKKEREAVQQFNISMRFVATHGGLTRWQQVPDSEEPEVEFGDWNNRAIDEDWYKAAVLLHEESQDSFLFSAPFDSGLNPDAPITGYTAVYHQDGGFEVPAAVVGFQMPLSELQKHMLTVTESLSSPECMNNTSLESCGCSSEEITCYMLDANGYVVVSEEVNETGRFFGDVAPDAMVALHQLQVYRKVPLYDYQALCIKVTTVHSGAAELLITPLRWIQWVLGWIVGQFIQILANDLIWSSTHALEDHLYDDYDFDPGVQTDTVGSDDDDSDKNKTRTSEDPYPCDKLRYLALLELTANNGSRVYIAPVNDAESTTFSDLNETSTEQPESSSETPASSSEMLADEPADEPAITEAASKEKEDIEDETLTVKDKIEVFDEDLKNILIGDDITEKPVVFIGRSLIAQRVPFTNLVLVVIDGLRSESHEVVPERWSPEAIEVYYANATHPCHKLPLNNLTRRRLAGCLSEHPLESEIEQCGRAGLQGVAHGLLAAMFLLASIVPYLATIPH